MLEFKFLPTAHAVTYTVNMEQHRSLGAKRRETVFLALNPVGITRQTMFTPPVTWVSNSLYLFVCYQRITVLLKDWHSHAFNLIIKVK